MKIKEREREREINKLHYKYKHYPDRKKEFTKRKRERKTQTNKNQFCQLHLLCSFICNCFLKNLFCMLDQWPAFSFWTSPSTVDCFILFCVANEWNICGLVKKIEPVVDSSVGRVLSFSHEGPRFKSRRGHLFILLLICDLIDVKLMSINVRLIYVDCWLMLEPIGTMHAERDHLKIV
jgi:hypothetical protein